MSAPAYLAPGKSKVDPSPLLASEEPETEVAEAATEAAARAAEETSQHLAAALAAQATSRENTPDTTSQAGAVQQVIADGEEVRWL